MAAHRGTHRKDTETLTSRIEHTAQPCQLSLQASSSFSRHLCLSWLNTMELAALRLSSPFLEPFLGYQSFQGVGQAWDQDRFEVGKNLYLILFY